MVLGDETQGPSLSHPSFCCAPCRCGSEKSGAGQSWVVSASRAETWKQHLPGLLCARLTHSLLDSHVASRLSLPQLLRKGLRVCVSIVQIKKLKLREEQVLGP